MATVCVVHLVRHKNGLAPFRSFLESYLGHPAGIDHDVLILYKGFARHADIESYEALLADVHHSFLMVTDSGFDLGPYFLAAEKSENEYLCFLNSFSVILDDDWLLKLYRHISTPGVGLVGATGSWGSICPGRIGSDRTPPLWKRLLRPLTWRASRAFFSIYFEAFPNYHVRTNGFLIARDTMLGIRHGRVSTKIHAYLLESGRNSITRQIERRGLRPLVVGKDGRGYEKQEWDASNTFWRDGQSNLLIADNQTRGYAAETPENQRMRESFAWGHAAENPHADKSGEV